MTVIALFPALVAVIGLIVYALAKDKAAELGRLAYFAGLLVFLMVLAHHVVRVG